MAFFQLIFPLHSKYLFGESSSRNMKEPMDMVDEMSKRAGSGNIIKIMIIGPDTVDKTSLVFQAGVSAASAGLMVTYICTHPLKRLPSPVHGMPTPEPATMKNVDFLYFEECNELITWLASIHTKARLPNLIIIEDVLAYACQINENQIEKSLARLCATIFDAASWISSKSKNHKCSVIMTAPSRAISFTPVLLQFGFKIAEYHSPHGDLVSELSCRENGKVSKAKFKRHKDCLIVTEILASRHSDQETMEKEKNCN